MIQRYFLITFVLATFGISMASITGQAERLLGIDPLAPIEKLTDLARGFAPPKSETVKVVRVVDGDTIVVKSDGSRKTVRIIGVDTPESVKRNHPVECFARKASAKTKDRLNGKTVTLTYDAEREDKYGRTLAYVGTRSGDYGHWLIRNGYARALAIAPNTDRADRYSDSENHARETYRGLWGACE